MDTNLLDDRTPEADLKSLALGVAGVNMGLGYSKLVLDAIDLGIECIGHAGPTRSTYCGPMRAFSTAWTWR